MRRPAATCSPASARSRVERGLIAADGETTTVRIRLLNTGDLATQTFATPDGRVDYDGASRTRPRSTASPAPPRASTSRWRPRPTRTAAADRQRRRRDRRAPRDAHRQRDAGGAAARRRVRHHGRRESPAELEQNAELTAAVERIRLARRPAHGARRRHRRDRPQDVPALAPRAAAARSRPGPSSRTGCTPRSACSWRHPSRRASASPARSAPSSRTRPTTGRSRSSTRAASFPSQVSVGRSDDGMWRATSTLGAHRPQDLRRRGLPTTAPVTRDLKGPEMTEFTSFDVAHIGNVELLTAEVRREPVVLPRPARDARRRRRGRLGLPAHVGRVPAVHDQAHRRRMPPASGSPPSAPPARRRSSAGSRRSRRPGSVRAGPTARSAPARRTSSATPTATRWASTTRPSATSRPTTSRR